MVTFDNMTIAFVGTSGPELWEQDEAGGLVHISTVHTGIMCAAAAFGTKVPKWASVFLPLYVEKYNRCCFLCGGPRLAPTGRGFVCISCGILQEDCNAK